MPLALFAGNFNFHHIFFGKSGILIYIMAYRKEERTMKPGVFTAKKADGTLYYRSSFTYKNKHISLGSFPSEDAASMAYMEAVYLIDNKDINLSHYNKKKHFLNHKKWVSILNFRDNGLYFKTPIYLKKNYFEYWLDIDNTLKFDVDDLFYYSTHSIMKRGGHLFVSDYGMQVNILNRYGIKNFAVSGKDYRFVNGDSCDFRYINIDIINRYNGVTRFTHKGLYIYTARIHINGDYIIGRYSSEEDAAIAYNKAVDILKSKGLNISFQKNYIEKMDSIQYASRYNSIKISKKLRDYNP